MRKKKIVYLVEAFWGWVFTYLVDLINWTAQDYEITVLYWKRSETPKNIQSFFSNWVNFIEIKNFKRWWSPITALKAIFEVKKEIKKLNPDIVYCHSSIAGGIGRLALAFSKIEIFYNAHGRYFNANKNQLKNWIYALVEKILGGRTDKIINISKAELKSAKKRHIAPDKKLVLIENAIDFDKFTNFTQKKKKNSEFIIWMASRLDEQKDPMTFIKMAKIVHEKQPNTKFLLIWDWQLKTDILNYAKENWFLDKVEITGWVQDVKPYLWLLDVWVLSSRYEGFWLVILEYIACSKPVVATKTWWIADIITNENQWFLVKVGDYQTMAEKVLFYLNNPEFTKETTEKNLTYYKQRFGIQNLLAQHKKLFNFYE